LISPYCSKSVVYGILYAPYGGGCNSMAITRVEVTPKQGTGMRDVRGDVVRRQLMADHGIDVSEVRSITGFLIKSSVPSSDISERVNDLFSDPIIEDAVTDTLFLTSPLHFPITPDAAITVGFKPGVTDNPGSAAYDGFRTIFTQDEPLEDASISTYQTYIFYGLPSEVTAEWLATTLHNNLIQRAEVADGESMRSSTMAGHRLPRKTPSDPNPPSSNEPRNSR
jgi:phosphoribosylformylglycinamidine synthase